MPWLLGKRTFLLKAGLWLAAALPACSCARHLSVCFLAGSHARWLVCSAARPPTCSHACSLDWPPACPSADSDVYTTWLPAHTGVHVSDSESITRPPFLRCFVHTDHQAAGTVWPLASISTYSLGGGPSSVGLLHDAFLARATGQCQSTPRLNLCLPIPLLRALFTLRVRPPA